MQVMFITRLCRKELRSTEYNRDQRTTLERKVRKITVLNSQVWEAAILETTYLAWRSGQGQRVKPEYKRGEMALWKPTESWEGNWCPSAKLYNKTEREEEPNVVLRRRRKGMQRERSRMSCWAEKDHERDRCSPTSACSTNLSLCQRNISLFRKREFILVPGIIFLPFWIKNRSTFK